MEVKDLKAGSGLGLWTLPEPGGLLWCRCVGFGFWGFRAAEVQPICRVSDPYSRVVSGAPQDHLQPSQHSIATFGVCSRDSSIHKPLRASLTPNSPKLEALDPILQALRLKDHVVHHVSKTITFVRLKDASGSVEGLHLGGSCFLLGLCLILAESSTLFFKVR